MHYPREDQLLEAIRTKSDSILVHREHMRAEMKKAAEAGIVAGHVVSVLYALATSPWSIPEPSLEKAIHVAEQFAYRERFADGSPMPRGRTEIRKCLDSMRPVAHLWAALRLHRQYPIRRHEDLLKTAEGMSRLLRIARGVQSWAIDWRPQRGAGAPSLLGDRPWIIPNSVRPLFPPWLQKQPDWLLSTVGRYKRRSR